MTRHRQDTDCPAPTPIGNLDTSLSCFLIDLAVALSPPTFTFPFLQTLFVVLDHSVLPKHVRILVLGAKRIGLLASSAGVRNYNAVIPHPTAHSCCNRKLLGPLNSFLPKFHPVLGFSALCVSTIHPPPPSIMAIYTILPYPSSRPPSSFVRRRCEYCFFLAPTIFKIDIR
jgi:hypothetical protein